MHETSKEKDIATIRNDILTMVGGHFTGVALGLPLYEEILERARTHAKEYLDVFESMFLGANFNALTQSNLLLPLFLQYLADVEPERVKAIAEQIIKQYDAVLVFHDAVKDRAALLQLLPNETVNLSHRLQDRRMELRELIK